MSDDEIARLQRRYRELQKRLQSLGFAVAGTITERYTACGKANCCCNADPPQRHGPYYQYSRKVAGKYPGGYTEKFARRLRYPSPLPTDSHRQRR